MATLMLPCFAISGGSSTAMAEASAAHRNATARKRFIVKIAPSDHRREKGLGSHFTGRAENIRRRPGFHDGAMVHINNGICDLAREAEFMGHHHHRHAD